MHWRGPTKDPSALHCIKDKKQRYAPQFLAQHIYRKGDSQTGKDSGGVLLYVHNQCINAKAERCRGLVQIFANEEAMGKAKPALAKLFGKL